MLNLFLLFVPVAFILEYMGASPTLIFLASALAIVPLAGWLGHATEELAGHLGAAVGGLLNATFGNATELIIAFFALLAGQAEVVKASLVGSIIGNVLLVLGLAALIGGWRRERQRFNVENIKILSSMMVIAMIGFMVPAVFDFNERVLLAEPATQAQILDADLSLGVAIVLLILYVGNIVFSLVTHKDLLSSSDEIEENHRPGWTIPKAIAVLLGVTILIAFLSEFLVGALEGFAETIGLSTAFVGLIVIPIIGNAAEHSSAVTFAMKNKMDLAVVIAIGSAIQIALLVAPLLVLLSWVIGNPMDLVLRGPLELVALIGSVLIGNSVSRDGETNWYEGLMLLGVYVILAIAFFFTPGVSG